MQNNMDLIFREAIIDIPNIVKLLADDELGVKRVIIKFHYQRITMMHSKIFIKTKTKPFILENFNKDIIGTLHNYLYTILNIPRWFKSSNRSSKNSQRI